MSPHLKRALGAAILTLAGLGGGYALGYSEPVAATPHIPAETVAAPAKNSLRVIYSLDQKQTDKELIAIIDAARTHVYFAIYTFTLDSVADALIRAKKRGVEVRGLVDAEQAGSSYSKPVIAKLIAAGIPIVTQRHPSGTGIMHLKTLVTDDAYVTGSFNWTNSANTINDELIEIGTDPIVVEVYRNVLRRLLEAYRGNAAAGAAASVSGGVYDYTEAKNHIGEYASVRGTLISVYTSAKGTVFLDFCRDYKSCPFSGVIFADDAAAFPELSEYVGTQITLTGTISSYQGRAEIKLSDPSHLTQ